MWVFDSTWMFPFIRIYKMWEWGGCWKNNPQRNNNVLMESWFFRHYLFYIVLNCPQNKCSMMCLTSKVIHKKLLNLLLGFLLAYLNGRMSKKSALKEGFVSASFTVYASDNRETIFTFSSASIVFESHDHAHSKIALFYELYRLLYLNYHDTTSLTKLKT